jgi:hypothetical protein
MNKIKLYLADSKIPLINRIFRRGVLNRNEVWTNSLRSTFWMFWAYDIKPWFIKTSYMHKPDGNHIYFYRWERYLRPFWFKKMKNL